MTGNIDNLLQDLDEAIDTIKDVRDDLRDQAARIKELEMEIKAGDRVLDNIGRYGKEPILCTQCLNNATPCQLTFEDCKVGMIAFAKQKIEKEQSND